MVSRRRRLREKYQGDIAGKLKDTFYEVYDKLHTMEYFVRNCSKIEKIIFAAMDINDSDFGVEQETRTALSKLEQVNALTDDLFDDIKDILGEYNPYE